MTEKLYGYIITTLNVEERSALLCKLAGWFLPDPGSEFWDAVEQLTQLERAWCSWCDRPQNDCVCHLDPNGLPDNHWSKEPNTRD